MIFERNVPGSTEKLQQATVGIAGCGGLGSNAAVALVRAGVGRLILADFDSVELSNLNRQYFFQADVDKPKTEALARHLIAINPDVELVLYQEKLTAGQVRGVFTDADLLIEAFDKAESKQWLIESWSEAFPDRPIVAASGLSGLGDTGSLKIKHAGSLVICGDGHSEMNMGLCSARVAIAANMQANVAIALLTGAEKV